MNSTKKSDCRKRNSVGEWIQWDGGECPVDPECEVIVELRNGGRYTFQPSRMLIWNRSSNFPQSDIIAYAVVNPFEP